MCIFVSQGKAEVSVYFKIDTFRETIPTKGDTHNISVKLSTEIDELEEIKR